MNLFKLPLYCCVFLCQLALAQTTNTWQDLGKENGVTLSFQINDCKGTEFLFFKVYNSTDKPISALYSVRVTDENGKVIFMLPTQPRLVQAGKTESGDCEHATSDYSKPLPKAHAYNVDLINLTIH